MGLEAESYSVSEAEEVLSVCAVIINGQTERDVSVEFSIAQLPDTTAQGRQLCSNLQSVTLHECMHSNSLHECSIIISDAHNIMCQQKPVEFGLKFNSSPFSAHHSSLYSSDRF